ncbi:MAG: tetratricopeptide repeat protein [Calditrichaeota bacterium]|nr:tetratricopeptide repeat protein [Calditrichota bacterium]
MAAKSKSTTAKNTTLLQKILLIGFGLLVILIIELLLQAFDVADRFSEADPFVGFENVYPLFGEKKAPNGEKIYRTNSNKLSFFNDQQFFKAKPDSVFRIFCFGGSTTYGRPYRAETAFPRWLEINLNLADATHHYEVINCGGISYASYRIVNLVKEAANYQPDLFIVYSGHNEFLEARTYENILKQDARLKKVRVLLDKFQTYRLLRKSVNAIKQKIKPKKTKLKGEVSAILDASAGLDRYTRESIQKKQTISHFRYNLERIIQLSRERAIPLILCTVVSNVKDFSPFKSEHKSDLSAEQVRTWDKYFQKGIQFQEQRNFTEALTNYYEDFSIDDQYAELAFRIAQCLYATNQFELAKKYFFLAQELDVCPLRAPAGINQAIRNLSAQYQIPLVDLEPLFADAQNHSIPGSRYFIDHVHPTIRAQQMIAEKIAETLKQKQLVPTQNQIDQKKLHKIYAAELQKLPTNYFKEGILNLAKVLGWAGKEKEKYDILRRNAVSLKNNFEYYYMIGNSAVKNGELDKAIGYFKKAIALNSGFSESYTNLGFALENSGFPDEAMKNYQKALELDPEDYVSQSNIGRIYYIQNKLEEAKKAYQAAIKLKPDYPHAHEGLGVIYHKQGNYNRALEEFKKAISYNPNYAEAYYDLGLVLFEQFKTDSAIVYFKKAIQCQPDYADAYSSLGVCYYRKKMLKEAIESLETAVSLNSNLAKAHNNLAVAYHSAGKIDLAWQHIQLAKNLGYQIHPEFVKLLQKERGKIKRK